MEEKFNQLSRHLMQNIVDVWDKKSMPILLVDPRHINDNFDELVKYISTKEKTPPEPAHFRISIIGDKEFLTTGGVRGFDYYTIYDNAESKILILRSSISKDLIVCFEYKDTNISWSSDSQFFIEEK